MKFLEACTPRRAARQPRARIHAIEPQGRLQRCLAVVVLCAHLFAAALQPSAASAQKASESTSTTALVFAVVDKSGRNNADLEKAVRKAVAETVPAKLVDPLHAPRKKLQDARTAAQCPGGSADRSAACLRAISQQLGAALLFAPSLDRGPDDLVLTILMFDGREGGKVNEVAHWQDGVKVSPETLQALPQLIHGLFAPPTPPPAPALAAESAPAGAPDLQLTAADTAPRESSRLLAPLIVVGAGALVLGAGIVSGTMMRSSEDKYNALEVRTRADADEAASLLSSAKAEATVSKICFGVSTLAIAAGGAWLSYELFGRGPSERTLTRVTPFASHQQVGLVIRYQGGSL
jgi:hypothetical protein